MRLVAEIALVAVAAIGVCVCLALLPETRSTPRRRAAVPEPSRPEQLVRLESLVMMAGTSAIQVHAYLRPLLVEIASRRLAARGRALEQMPESIARQLLGDQLWEIVRPDRPFPEERHARGISSQDLREVLAVLERL